MSAMNHAEAEELLGAYALDALTEDERQRIEEHFRSCDEHREAAAELRRTAALLALTVDDRDPSPSLGRRIAEAVGATAQPATVPSILLPPPTTITERRVGRGRRLWMRPAYLAVAAALVLALAAGALVGRLTVPNAATVGYSFQGDATHAPGAQARLVYFKDQQAAVVAATGLPKLASGQVYEIWLIGNGVPVDEGIGSSTNGDLAARLTADISRFQQFAITIEPGEQRRPTTMPILLGNLRTGS